MALRAKMAALAEQLDDRLDQKIDQAAAATSKLQAAAKARVQMAPAKPLAPPTPPPRAGGGVAIDMAAATKAFESVPKEELVGLLAKTNSRCRELEMRPLVAARTHLAPALRPIHLTSLLQSCCPRS